MYFFGALAVILLLERVKKFRAEREPADQSHLLMDFIYFLQTVTFRLLAAYLMLILMRQGLWNFGPRSDIHPVLAGLLSFLAADLAIFLAHRTLHFFSFSWAIHAAHHSVMQLNTLASFRRHAAEHILYSGSYILSTFFFVIYLRWPPTPFLAAWTLTILWDLVVHANLRLPESRFVNFLSLFFFLPSTHRVHHLEGHSEFNFGNMLTIWDRLGGTYLSSAGLEKLPTGFRKRHYPQEFWAQLKAPFRDEGGQTRR